jgi:rhodanese-related sulfurtransferase
VARGIAALAVAAAAAAAVSNAVAGPERRLDWTGRPAATGMPAAGGAVTGSARPVPPAPSAGPAASPASPGSVVSSAAWQEISGEEADRLQHSGALFLDARRSSEYRDGHVPGARSVPVWEAGLDEKVRALFSERPDQSAPIVVYCNGGECEDSHELAQKLYLAGFDGVRVYRDGFPDWARRGRPVTHGANP